jgi:hypothetical protein
LSLSHEDFSEKFEKTGDDVDDEEDCVDSYENVVDDCDDDNNNTPLACLLIFNPVCIFSSHRRISFSSPKT